MTNAAIAIIQAIIVLVVSFGVPVTDAQATAIIGVTSAIAVLLGGGTAALIGRSQVIPKNRNIWK